MRPRLVLFDIDGTLLSAGGVSARALKQALVETFGTAGPAAGYDYSGKTDPQIVRELMLDAGFADEQIQALRPLTLDRYSDRLAEAIRPADVTPKPGVLALLGALAAEGRVTLGLLTGNLERCARLKVQTIGASGFFEFGAYGSDHEDRYRLPSIALHRARAATGTAFEGPDTVMVGDSIHDVLCGRSLGVRAVAVATGRTSTGRLAETRPDALLADLSDTTASLEAILEK